MPLPNRLMNCKGQLALPQDFCLAGIDAALGQRRADGRRLRAARHPDVDASGLASLGRCTDGAKSCLAN
jgi:hypothetical protein